jgi:hypothetical protein
VRELEEEHVAKAINVGLCLLVGVACREADLKIMITLLVEAGRKEGGV